MQTEFERRVELFADTTKSIADVGKKLGISRQAAHEQFSSVFAKLFPYRKEENRFYQRLAVSTANTVNSTQFNGNSPRDTIGRIAQAHRLNAEKIPVVSKGLKAQFTNRGLRINNSLCEVFIVRRKIFLANGRPYARFRVSANRVQKLNFVIAVQAIPYYRNCTYVIPAEKVLQYKKDGKGRISFSISLIKARKRRPPRVNFERYAERWSFFNPDRLRHLKHPEKKTEYNRNWRQGNRGNHKCSQEKYYNGSRAENSGKKMTNEEKLLILTKKVPDHIIAKRLKRSIKAVEVARAKMLKGRIPLPSPLSIEIQ